MRSSRLISSTPIRVADRAGGSALVLTTSFGSIGSKAKYVLTPSGRKPQTRKSSKSATKVHLDLLPLLIEIAKLGSARIIGTFEERSSRPGWMISSFACKDFLTALKTAQQRVTASCRLRLGRRDRIRYGRRLSAATLCGPRLIQMRRSIRVDGSPKVRSFLTARAFAHYLLNRNELWRRYWFKWTRTQAAH